MIEVKAPGKIMLAGEWGVLEPGNSCIVLPVQKYVTVQLVPLEANFMPAWFDTFFLAARPECRALRGVSKGAACKKHSPRAGKNDILITQNGAVSCEQIIFNSQDIDLIDVVLRWDGVSLANHANISQVQKLRFKPCFIAIQNSLQFLSEQGAAIKPFELTVISEISNVNDLAMPGHSKFSFCKPGLGSSAAVVVAVCKAILKFHDFDTDSVKNVDLIFKLACISHYLAFGKLGSGFDVACSTYQKPIIYSRFDPEWLKSKLELKVASKLGSKAEFGQKISDIIFADWPNLEIKEIKMPEKLRVLIGFTGCSASTHKMIEKMHKFRQENLVQYKKIMESINSVVCKLVSALKCCDQVKIIDLINKNRDLLAQLSIESGIELETQELKKLVGIAQRYGAAAKLSGAGGGDCGIAVCFDKVAVKKISDEWNCVGIKSL